MGTKTCEDANPQFKEDSKYFIYAVDRKHGYLDVVFKAKSKKQIIDTLKEIAEGKYHSKWAKKYMFCEELGEEVFSERIGWHYPNSKEYFLPVIELHITDGEWNWDTAVELLLDIDNKKLMFYDRDKTCVKNGEIEYTKEWDGKLSFKQKNI